VTLIERDAVLMNRASLRNEGKIHLGFVYAQSPTLETARLMMRGALCFRRLLAGWTGGALERLRLSTPFLYLSPEGSQLTPDELAAHYATVEELYRGEDGDYLGARPERLWRRLERAEYAKAVGQSVRAGFATEEAAVDLEQLAARLREAVEASPRIETRFGVTVESAERGGAGFRVKGRTAEGDWSGEFDQVVNALWDGRLAVDATVAELPKRPWVYRLKYRVLVDLPERLRGLPSMTFVLGAYGDVVTRPGAPTYVSWYPECMQGWSEATAPPREWNAACEGNTGEAVRRELGRRALEGFEPLVPGLAEAEVRTVDAGVIFAWGAEDITETGSELHRRDEIGVASFDGYHTVNTG
jgi:hypothetical protein